MKKALLVSTVSRQFTLFDQDNINILQELGYEVHCAANFNDATIALDKLNIIRHHIDIQRSPFSLVNIKAGYQLMKLMRKGNFDLVHCHAPMGGLLGRICAMLTKTKPVLYTAHGFHFYQGAPTINNLVYKGIERFAASCTDGLLTMNEEDYNAAKRFRLRKEGRVYYIPGVGVDTVAINEVKVERSLKRKEINVPEDAFLMLSIGELIERKNHKQAIKVLAELKKEGYDQIYYAICGRGALIDELRELCDRSGVADRVIFLGYRTDITEILKVSDLFVFTSFQEGLPKSVMEAMAAGLPIVATKIRGNIDLIDNGKNGFLVECNDLKGTEEAIKKIYLDKEAQMAFSKNSLNKIKEHDTKVVKDIMLRIYSDFEING
ncbi:glycosyltransferase family 4 protein [Bacillus thuringiensis]|uniref:glycosyltransferase family 4 protein n=1 Tax=Bacillus thuringiensis TaxID=1428 RepID=UPI00339371BA